MSRTLKITYAGLILGDGQSGTDYHLTGKVRYQETYREASVEFEVVISTGSAASMLSAEATLIAAYTQPDQKLEVQLSSTDRYEYDPADGTNTALYTSPSIQKLGGIDDTAQSVRYRCTVTAQLPADLSGRLGRLESSVDIAEDASEIRTITFTGVYTALATNAARAQFEAQFDTFATDYLTALGGGATWHQVGEPRATEDTQNKRLTFTRVYREQIYTVTGASTLINPKVEFLTSEVGLNDSLEVGSVAPFKFVDASFVGKIQKSQLDLTTVWESTVMPFVREEMRGYADSGINSVIVRNASYDKNTNLLSGQLRLQVDGGSQFFAAKTSLSDRIDHGTILKPVWSGNIWARDKHQGPGSWVRTATRRTTGRLTAGDPHPPPVDYPGFELVREAHRREPISYGVRDEVQTALGYTSVYVYVRVDAFNFGSGSGGGGGVGGTVTRPGVGGGGGGVGGGAPNPDTSGGSAGGGAGAGSPGGSGSGGGGGFVTTGTPIGIPGGGSIPPVGGGGPGGIGGGTSGGGSSGGGGGGNTITGGPANDLPPGGTARVNPPAPRGSPKQDDRTGPVGGGGGGGTSGNAPPTGKRNDTGTEGTAGRGVSAEGGSRGHGDGPNEGDQI